MTDLPLEPLPCGGDQLAVVDRARAGESTAHEQACPHCQEQIVADRRGRSARLALAADESEHTVPPGLVPTVMHRVRAELRPSRMLALPSPDGPARVASSAIVTTVDHALSALAGLQVRTCNLDSTSTTPARELAFRVSANAAYDVDLIELADRARRVVRAAVAEQFGCVAKPIDIDIVDLYEPADAHR